MESGLAINCVKALADQRNLDVFRVLLQSSEAGLRAEEVQRRLLLSHDLTQSSLRALSTVQLIHSTGRGPSASHAVDLDRLYDLMKYLDTDCCSGDQEACSPLADLLTAAVCQRNPGG